MSFKSSEGGPLFNFLPQPPLKKPLPSFTIAEAGMWQLFGIKTVGLNSKLYLKQGVKPNLNPSINHYFSRIQTKIESLRQEVSNSFSAAGHIYIPGFYTAQIALNKIEAGKTVYQRSPNFLLARTGNQLNNFAAHHPRHHLEITTSSEIV